MSKDGSSGAAVRVRAGAWFHTLVVMGASLSGCGGNAEPGPGPAATGGSGNSAGAGASGGAPSSTGGAPARPSPSDCESDAQFSCSDFAALADCHCRLEAPTSPSSCQSPYALLCIEYSPDFPNLALPTFVDCRCAEKPPLPGDCGVEAQFFCQESKAGLVNCGCDTSLPVTQADCRSVEIFSCQSYDPMFGCRCECCRIK